MLGNGNGIRIEFRLPQFGSIDTTAGMSPSTRIENTSEPLIGFSLSNGTIGITMDSGCTPGEKKGFDRDYINAPIPLKKSLGEVCVKVGAAPVQRLSVYLTSNTAFCNPTCTLKFSVLRALKNESGETLPYIEYRVRGAGDVSSSKTEECFTKYKSVPDVNCGNNFFLTNPIPTQTATIISEAQTAGFKKTITKSYDQLTTSEGLDFTVFQ